MRWLIALAVIDWFLPQQLHNVSTVDTFHLGELATNELNDLLRGHFVAAGLPDDGKNVGSADTRRPCLVLARSRGGSC